MAKKRDTDSVFKSDLITITVGPSKERFTAHKAILTKEKYFRGALEGNFPEKEHREVVLLEDDPEVVERLLEFLYFGKIEAESFDTEVREEPERAHLSLLAKIYVAADKFCMEDCQNHVMDHFREVHGIAQRRLPCPEAIMQLKGLPESPLRKYLLAKLAIVLCGQDYIYDAALERDKSILELIRGGGAGAEDVFVACLNLTKRQNRWEIVSAYTGTSCDFHVHNITQKCKTTNGNEVTKKGC